VTSPNTSAHLSPTHARTQTYTTTHDTDVACQGTTKYKPVQNTRIIKTFSNSEFIRQTASTEPDVSDVYMRRIYSAGSNICVIQRGFHYIPIREMDSPVLSIYLYIRGTP